MPNYTYRGITLSIPENDSEYKGYFEAAGEGRLVVKKCADCGCCEASRGRPARGARRSTGSGSRCRARAPSIPTRWWRTR